HRSGLRARTAGRGPGVSLIAFPEGANDAGRGRVLTEEKSMTLVARVRADYFPPWRSASKRTVRFAEPPRNLANHAAFCDAYPRTIWINRSEPPLETLIHEMCHAVTPGGHGMKWQERMRLAARDAETYGDRALARALRGEVQSYFETPKITARGAYSWIDDAIDGGASVDAAIDWAADQCAMTRERFLPKYKRGRRVAESAFRARR